ncbi:hypothetical protein FHS39_000701 [Streptomyces olivoverticillatus]|uniref:Uncharacterized protein n=1 Tax=Streptomyces olivoverticillatus TaxID=66427 RepID=A0A7W7LL89_9ACTN|nr:hypothetical protein [Streptomyces olivoverticillatus]
MQSVGFFRELEPDNPSTFKEPIKDSLQCDVSYAREDVARYLDGGHPIFDIMESTVDVIGNVFRVPGGSSVMTDGEFVWRTDLSSYVTRYSIRLPEEFLKFMQEKQFKVPDVPRTRLLELSLAVGRMLNFRDNPGAGPQAK